MSDTAQLDRPANDADHVATGEDSLTRKSRWINWAVMLVLVMCLLIITNFRPFDFLRPRQPWQPNQQLTELQLQPLTGTSRSVSLGDLTGRVVLLNFWGTWCPPCRAELPHIAEIHEAFRGQTAFRLLAVSCGRGGRENLGVLRQNTEEYLREANLRLPTYADPDYVSRVAVEKAVGFHGYPTTLLIDRRGVIRSVWSGYEPGTEDEMRQMISTLLAEG